MLIKFNPGDIFDGHYRLLRTLSTAGGTADVWLAADLNTVDQPATADGAPDESTAMQVAVKIYRPQNALDIEGEQRFRDEFKIVYNCHHTNLVQPTHYSIWNEVPYLVLPYCRRGSSETMVGKLTDENEVWRYIHDVAAGLAYLHAMQPPIIHQDVKPANVLIDDNGNYALTDFGISATRERWHTGEMVSGTLAYMAPERYASRNAPTTAGDIYALGVTLYELITGHVPFGEQGGHAQPEGAVRLAYGGKRVPDAVQRLIADCLDRDPDRRPTATAIAQAAQRHQWPPQQTRRTALWATIGAVATIGIAAFAVNATVGWDWLSNKKHVNSTEQSIISEPDPQKVYEHAIALANSDDSTKVKLGMTMLNTLAQTDSMAQAYYEISRTFGMRMDRDENIYIQRRKLLGITYGDNPAVARNVYGIFANNGGIKEEMNQLINDFASDNKNISLAYNTCIDLMSIWQQNENQEADSTQLRQMSFTAYTLGLYELLCYGNKRAAGKWLNQSLEYAKKCQDQNQCNLSTFWLRICTGSKQ